MKMKWMLLPGLLALCIGCGQQVVSQPEDIDSPNNPDTSMVADNPSETFASNDKSDDEAVAPEKDAKLALEEAVTAAKGLNKKVFVHYGSPS